MLIGLALMLSVSGCTQMESVTVPFVPASKLDGSAERFPGQFIAGAATVDITPPPNSLPRAGYSMWSTMGEGFRTRLYARAYYLRDAEGDAYLLIQTDLTSGSRILHTRLGELLAPTTDIDASNLTITATHSHSAPGQIVGSQFYNKHISHKAGFARDYFEFVLDKVHAAAQEAYQSAGPATLASGTRDVWGLTRNRSLEAHVENETVANKSQGDHRTFHSVNPSMHMVRIDRLVEGAQPKPLAAFASFSIHGTALPGDETLYNADLWAYMHLDWANAILKRTAGDAPVHFSAFEGTHGDVAPASRFGMLGYIEAKRVGQALGKEASRLYDQLGVTLSQEVNIQTAARSINIRKAYRIEDVQICDEAAAGMTLAAAPLEHTSPVIGYLPFFKQGSRRWGEEEDNCQGRKRILGFSWLQPLFEPKDSFPEDVLFQQIRINDLVIAPFPFELTVESGRRIESELRSTFDAKGLPIKHIMVTSLAGGYTGYITTPEEYGRQYYEGGHTLYGKHSLPFLQAHSRLLASDWLSSGGNVVDMPAQWQYHFEMRDFLPAAADPLGERREVQTPVFTHAEVNEEGRWAFRWEDAAPANMLFHQPLVSVEMRAQQADDWRPLVREGVAVNDQGYDLSVRMISGPNEQGMAVYEASWHDPLFQGESIAYRFAIAPRESFPTFYSSEFH